MIQRTGTGPDAQRCDAQEGKQFVFSKHEPKRPMAGQAGSGVESRKQLKGLPVKVYGVELR
jgi:hypothetical protein